MGWDYTIKMKWNTPAPTEQPTLTDRRDRTEIIVVACDFKLWTGEWEILIDYIGSGS